MSDETNLMPKGTRPDVIAAYRFKNIPRSYECVGIICIEDSSTNL